MNKKFENVPHDQGTVVIFEKEHTIGQYEVLYQIWRWGLYTANSIIFANEDVADLAEEEIKTMVKNDSVFKGTSSISFKRSKSGFTFVNFNFELDEPSFSVDWEKIKKDTQHVERWKKEIKEWEEAYKDKGQKPVN